MIGRGWQAGVAALALLGASVASHAAPTSAPTAKAKAAKPKKKLVAEVAPAQSLRAGTLGSFTPSIVDRTKLPASRTQTVESNFRFTPSGKVADRKALSVGVNTRVIAADATRATAAPTLASASGYNLGLAVGYLGFSLAGGYSELDTGIGGQREGVDLGFSYRGRRWKTSLQATADQPSRDRVDPFSLDKRYAVELGGAYALTPRLSLQGGMRYQLSEPANALRLDERDDGTVYLGTAFSF